LEDPRVDAENNIKIELLEIEGFGVVCIRIERKGGL
jgi:hypothetical protein